jgi:hypothetical protein
LQIVVVLFWSVNCLYRICFRNTEINKTNELRNHRTHLGILGSDEHCPLILNGLLVIVINITWVLISIVVVAYFKFKFKSLGVLQPALHNLLNLLFIFHWEFLFNNFLELPINIMKVKLLFEETWNFGSANWTLSCII